MEQGKYQVVGGPSGTGAAGGGCFGVMEDGAMLYDLLETRQEAHDIAFVLNNGCAEEWEAVEEALSRLVVVKDLMEDKSNG